MLCLPLTHFISFGFPNVFSSSFIPTHFLSVSSSSQGMDRAWLLICHQPAHTGLTLHLLGLCGCFLLLHTRALSCTQFRATVIEELRF